MLRTAARSLPLAALLLFVAGLSLRPMAESDLFFHLKAGQEIRARHGLPGRNLYSFTAPDYPDLDTSWLAEVGAATVFAHGGFPALVVAKTLVLLLAFAGAYGLCRRRGAGAVASALALAAAAFVGRDRFVERPHIFSLAGAVATLAAIDALWERRSEPTAAARAAALFLAAVVLWANLHAGVFVAPVLVGAAAVVAATVGRDRAGALRLALLAAGAALATLVTPVGWGLVRYLRLHLVLPALHPVDEFRAPTWLSDGALVVYAGRSRRCGSLPGRHRRRPCATADTRPARPALAARGSGDAFDPFRRRLRAGGGASPGARRDRGRRSPDAAVPRPRAAPALAAAGGGDGRPVDRGFDRAASGGRVDAR